MLIAFVLAVLLHVAAFGVLALFAVMGWLSTPRDDRPLRDVQVAMRPISADDWARNRGDVPQQQQQQKPSPSDPRLSEKQRQEEKKKEEMPKGQVVDVAPGNDEEPKDADYIANSSNKVDRETRAKDQTPVYRNAMPKRTTTTPNDEAGRDAVEKKQRAGNDGMGQDDRPLRDGSEQKLALEVPDVKARDELKVDPDATEGPGPKVSDRRESAEVQGNSNRLRIQNGQSADAEDGSEGRAGKPGVVNLTPSQATLDKITGAAPNDHLKDVEEGDGTYLNTREWKYASFFNRVKQSIGMNWDPGRQLRQRDPTGSIYGAKDRHTVLQVTLDADGNVRDVYVEKSSGLDFLDLEAIHSFERAQPFPNPPPGLLAEDSTVKFTFGFFVELGGGPRMRIFRQH